MSVSLDIDISGINEIVETLKKMPDKLEKVRDRALVRVKAETLTAANKAIREKYTIKATDVRAVFAGKAKVDKDNLQIVLLGGLLTPIRFQHTPKTIPTLGEGGKRKKYIPTATIYKGEKKKLMPQLGVDGKKHPVFLAPTRTQNPNKIPHIFFHRTGADNKKGEEGRQIKPIKTTSIPQMVLNPKVAPKVQQAAVDVFLKRFTHEAERILSGKG